MNIINTSQSYLRPAAKIGIWNQLRTFDTLELPGGPMVWRRAGKVAMLMLPLVLVINLLIASAISSVEQNIAGADNLHHQLMDKNIEMLAKKARIWAPDHVRDLAAEKLSLYAGSKNQVGKYNRRKGTFSYL